MSVLIGDCDGRRVLIWDWDLLSNALGGDVWVGL